MNIKLHDAELRVMDVIWKSEEATASQISSVLKEKYGYSKTTTYTLIKRCIDKGAIKRIDPGFRCYALVTQAQAQELETLELINKLYDGAANQLVESVLNNKKFSQDEIKRIKNIVNEWGDKD
ncbi:MAG: BlaI/MecI/CopY family transcriptional regulator [Oscillospiraceae bacterium]|nr:BlaI/MecI/CopY family transcriptional regulator [Oscillospiraceae bacterium]